MFVGLAVLLTLVPISGEQRHRTPVCSALPACLAFTVCSSASGLLPRVSLPGG